MTKTHSHNNQHFTGKKGKVCNRRKSHRVKNVHKNKYQSGSFSDARQSALQKSPPKELAESSQIVKTFLGKERDHNT